MDDPKIVLVQPSDLLNRDLFLSQPLSFEYVASSLLLAGFKNVFFVDTRIEKISPEKLPPLLETRYGQIDIVCFTMFSQYFDSVREYSQRIKSFFPNVITIAGGPHPILEPEQTLRLNEFLDFAFCGEAEEGLPMLIKNLDKREEYEKIPNLVFRENDTIKINNKQFIRDLSKYPNLAHELIRPDIYPAVGTGFIISEKKVANIIATRGCPFNCSYCGATRISGPIIRKRSIEQIIDEMRLIYDKYNIKEFRFLDDNLTFDKNFVVSLSQAIGEEFKGRIKWACPNGVRIDRLDPETVMEMEKSGCYYFAVGIESGSQRVLELMKRGGLVRNKEYIRSQIAMIRKNSNITIVGFFVLGFPGSTHEEDEESIRFACELDLDGATYCIFSPIPGSDEWEKLKAENPDINPSVYTTYRVTYVAPGRSLRELKILKLKAFLKFYLRPAMVWKTLKYVKSFSQIRMILKRIFSF